MATVNSLRGMLFDKTMFPLQIRFRKRWFFLLYLLVGLPYLVLTGPFRAPDERNHFLRSYEISEGRFMPVRISEADVGDELPAGLSRLSEALGDHSDHRIDPAQIALARSIRLHPEKREFVEFSTAMYSPLNYLPATISIAVGRLCGAPPLSLVYFARCSNLLAGGWLLALSISHAGFARRAAVIVALFPMTVSQIATVTADALSYGLSFLWVSLVLEAVLDDAAKLTAKKILALAVVGCALSQLRPPYPFLVLLVLLIPACRFNEKKTAAFALAGILAVSVLPAVAWNASVSQFYVKPNNGERADPGEQLKWVARHPGPYLHRVKNDFRLRGLDYWDELVGRLGWLNVRLPPWIPIGFAAAAAASICSAPRAAQHLSWKQRAILLAIVFGGVIAIETTLYAMFNTVRSPWILGVQGRYFTPLAFVAVFAFSNSLLTRSRIGARLCAASLAFALVAHFGAYFALARAAGRI